MKSGLKEFVGQIKTIQVRIQGQVWISYWKWDQTSKRVSRSQRYPVTNRPAQTVRRHERERGLAARSKAVRLSRPFRRVDAVVVSSWGAHRKCSSGESASAPTVGVNTQNIQPRGPSYRTVATLISSTERDCKVHLKTWSCFSKIQICALAPLHGHLFTPDVFQKTPDLLNQKLIGKNSIYLSNLQNTVNAHKSRPLPREQRS